MLKHSPSISHLTQQIQLWSEEAEIPLSVSLTGAIRMARGCDKQVLSNWLTNPMFPGMSKIHSIFSILCTPPLKIISAAIYLIWEQHAPGKPCKSVTWRFDTLTHQLWMYLLFAFKKWNKHKLNMRNFLQFSGRNNNKTLKCKYLLLLFKMIVATAFT